MFVHSSTVCKKAEEHLWPGVVGGFPANCTGMDKLLFLNVETVSYINIDFL